MNPEISFDTFYIQYYSAMVSYCCHSFGLTGPDAEDAVGEAFTRLWSRWESIDPRTLPVLLAWIRKTVRNLSYDRNREIARKKTVELGEWIAGEEADPSACLIEDIVFGEQLYQGYLEQIRNKLSPRQRLLFDCIVIRKMDIPAAAKLLNRKEHSVRVALYRLRKKLKTDILPEILS